MWGKKEKASLSTDKIRLMRLLVDEKVGEEVRRAAWVKLRTSPLREELGSSGLRWVSIKAIDTDTRREADEALRESNVLLFSRQLPLSATREDVIGFLEVIAR